MIINQNKKLENAIAFFASEFHKRKNYWPAQMWIYKLLALLDFRILMATGRPCFGIEYKAMANGPVPSVLYSTRYDGTPNSSYQFIQVGYKRINIEALKEPDLDYFSDRVIDEMHNLVREFIDSGKELKDLINETHKLRSWKAARKDAEEIGRDSIPMRYEDEFEENPMLKDSDNLTFQEENFVEYETHRKEEEELEETA